MAGGAGSGKTLLGLQFLVAGAREYGEPGVLLTFEESTAKVSANVASLGFDLDGLQRDQLLVADAFRVDPAGIGEAGEFDFEPLFLLLDDAIERIGAKRVVLDTIEVLFGAFRDQAIVRAELRRLFYWLEERSVTAIVTGERGEHGLTRHGIEEYVSDCVIVLDQRVREEISTRILQGGEVPRVGARDQRVSVLDLGSWVRCAAGHVGRSGYGASEERISTGVPRLDHMLAGGPFRGSTVLVSGMTGTGKTTLGAHLIDSACARGERALLVLFEESPDQLIRNMRSVGLELARWVEAGLLRIWAARPTAYGLETHLAILARLIERGRAVGRRAGRDRRPHPRGLRSRGDLDGRPARSTCSRRRGITAMATTLAHEEETSTVSVSSLVDTWLLLRNVESNGERNRLLFVLKSRGSAHSNQVREFVLTDHGVELVDVYVGPAGIVTGSARLVQEAQQRDAAQQQSEELVVAGVSCGGGSWSATRSSPCSRTSSPPTGPSWSDSTCSNSATPPPLRRTSRRWPRGAGPIRTRATDRATMTPPASGDAGAEHGSPAETWELRLYVVGRSPNCLLAIENLRRACEQHLAGRYQIEIVDLLENPRRAADDQILAAPTLVRKLPEPVRKIVGDLSDSDRLLIFLGLDRERARLRDRSRCMFVARPLTHREGAAGVRGPAARRADARRDRSDEPRVRHRGSPDDDDRP